MQPIDVEVNSVYISAGCNRSPHCLSWRQDKIIYGCCNAVNLVMVDDKNSTTKIVETLASGGHTGRVNCVRWISNNVFVSSSTDKSVIVWKSQAERTRQFTTEFKPIAKLNGHTASVTTADGFFLDGGTDLLVASVSGDSTMKIIE